MLGTHCTDNPPNLSSDCGSGNIQEIGGLKTYVSGHQDSKLAILLLADAYGYEAPLLRKIADKIAGLGFLVVVPDFYYGDTYGPGKSPEGWLTAHSPDEGCDDAKKVIDALMISKGVSKIGAAGFCWGGMVVVRLAKYDCIQAGVVLHPGPITVEQINEVKTPIAILGAEFDEIAPPEPLKQFGNILSAKKVDSFVKIFPGVGHGWSVRYNEEDEFAVKSAEESHSDMINWLTKYIN